MAAVSVSPSTVREPIRDGCDRRESESEKDDWGRWTLAIILSVQRAGQGSALTPPAAREANARSGGSGWLLFGKV